VADVVDPPTDRVTLSGLDTTVYLVMGLPPVEAGAVQETVADPSPGEAETPLGAPGAVAAAAGVTGFDGLEGGPGPTALVALTVKV